jgi:uncharacterized protein Yka (UPF0111/DUF47 family)
MTVHERKVKAAEAAIEAVFSNTSVSQEETLQDLDDLADQIDMKRECIRRDLRREKEKLGGPRY